MYTASKPMRRSSAPTLHDVAREAGVSAMTVSVVVNGTGSNVRVSDDTRRRIHAAATRLHYRPNAYARGLSRRRMDTIGVVAVVDGHEVNLYFLEILNGVLEAAAENRQNTIVYSVKEWTEEHLNVTQFCDGRADGIVFIAPTLTAEFIEAMHQRHLPFVTIHHESVLPGIFNFDVENEKGARAMVCHLIAQGHRRILFLTGDMQSIDAVQRLAGYRDALEEAGVSYDSSLVVPGSYSSASGRQRTEQILSENRFASLPTAIFCGNDAIALGCMEALAEKQIRVPTDISVAGFDDTLTARITTPQLTTIRQPFRQMGRRAVEVLLPQIGVSGSDDRSKKMFKGTEQEACAVEEVLVVAADVAADVAASLTQELSHAEIFDVELIVRGSVGPPPTKSFSYVMGI